MTHYRGYGRDSEQPIVTRITPGHPTKVLDLRLDLANHSPTGFSWGYPGSGPAQLALAILADTAGDPIAKNLYQQFKEAFTARWDTETFILEQADILTWLEQKGINQARITLAADLASLLKAAHEARHRQSKEGNSHNCPSALHELTNAVYALEDALTQATEPRP